MQLFPIAVFSAVVLVLFGLWMSDFFSFHRLSPVGLEDLVPYFKTGDELQISSKIGERGVFATRDYSPGEVLEICPAIRQTHSLLGGEILHYVFSFDDDSSLIGFGYCSMYNHSDINNAEFTILNSQQIEIRASKPIRKGEEIFISYGDDYWEGREKK